MQLGGSSHLSVRLPCCYFKDLVVLAKGKELYFFVAEMVKIEGELCDLAESIFILLAVSQFDDDLGEREGT